ncbi:MAG TPA: hypothetical protein VFP68_11785 [Burkholderiaceae bacterium]|nr:hypothetical protein [Burkholderiaceae bacterium]
MKFAPSHRFAAILPLPVCLLLAACAGYAPTHVQTGQAEADVVREMGKPTHRYSLPDGGIRLEYARGPYGKHTYMIDLDRDGRVQRWTQVLTEENFSHVRAGESRDQLLLDLGRPSETRSGDWQGGRVWSYRYDAWTCQWFQVSLNDAGVVTSTSYGIDPHCDLNGNDRGEK